MAALRVTVPLLLTLFLTGHCSICELHSFRETFYTDLNYMIRENSSYFWYVLAFERPDLPYLTLYHLPENIETDRNCYGYHLTTRFGVILMDFVCLGKSFTRTLHSYDILTRPDGEYVTKKKAPHEVTDFQMVNVLQLTEDTVLLVSCSHVMNTYGVLVLHRGPVPVQDEGFFHSIIVAKFPDNLYRWMNYTATSVSATGRQCNCSSEFIIPIRTGSGDGMEHDKRKVFVLITCMTAMMLTGVVKCLKRLF